jgi:hypothetical protein
MKCQVPHWVVCIFCYISASLQAFVGYPSKMMMDFMLYVRRKVKNAKNAKGDSHKLLKIQSRQWGAGYHTGG